MSRRSAAPAGSIRHGMLAKLAGMVGLVLLVGVSVVYLFTVSFVQRTLVSSLRDKAIGIAEALDAGFENRGALLSADRLRQEVEDLWNSTENVDLIAVFRDREGRMQPFVSTEDSVVTPPTPLEQTELRRGHRITQRQQSRARGPYWRVLVPLHLDNRVRGAIEVRMSLQVASESVQKLRVVSGWVALASVAVSVLALAFFLHRSVERPVQRLLGTMSRVQSGDLEAQAALGGGAEFDRLSGGLNAMLGRIRAAAEENRRLLEEIQDFNARLGRRVAEKTAELEQRNVELSSANRTLVDLELRLARLSRLAAVGQFAAILAHEVGTPLHSISGHLELLREKRAVSPEHEHRIGVIQSQVERLAGIVRELLDSTRPPGTARRPVQLAELLAELAALLQPGLELRNIRISLDLPADLPRVAGDASQLQQVFLNLFTNAVDAMPRGGRLSVLARAENGGSPAVRCEVRDTGSGIDPSLLPQIFDPFVTSKARGEGTGLGLTVARDLVLRHGGTIEVESEPGRGSTFSVRLPVHEDGEDGADA